MKKLLIFTVLVCFSLSLSNYDKKELDGYIQTTQGNEILDDIKTMLDIRKSSNIILDRMDSIVQDANKEISKAKSQFDRENGDCIKLIQSKKQDQTNKKSQIDDLQKKPDEYKKQIQDISSLLSQKQSILEKKSKMFEQLKENKTFIFNSYLEIYNSYSEAEKFLTQVKQKISDIFKASKMNDIPQIEVFSKGCQKFILENQEIEHPYIPIILSMQGLLDNPDLGEIKKMATIVDNLIEDIQGTEQGFEELEKTRSTNFNAEIERIQMELDVGQDSLNQLQTYNQYLTDQISNVQYDIENINKDIELSDQQSMSQRAHCDNEQQQYEFKQGEREANLKILKRISDMLESDFPQTSEYILQLDLRLFDYTNKNI